MLIKIKLYLWLAPPNPYGVPLYSVNPQGPGAGNLKLLYLKKSPHYPENSLLFLKQSKELFAKVWGRLKGPLPPGSYVWQKARVLKG